MTVHKSIKRRVRARMSKTGERYTAARRQLTTPVHIDPPLPSEVETADIPAASQFRGERSASDEALATRTKHGWADWLALLDAWGAADRPHPEIARWLSNEHGVDSWWAQELTVRYEMAIGRRKPGQRADGFSITASKTIGVPVDRLFAAFADEVLRKEWLPGVSLRVRTATPHRSARFDWEDGSSRVAVGFVSKGEGRSSVALQHERIADSEGADRLRMFWRERMHELQRFLER